MATRRKPTPLPFVGVDGEGGDINGRHQYLMLRAGGSALETGAPLTHQDVFPFLTDLPHGHEYVSYFFDYDCTMFLRSLPGQIIGQLLDREGRTNSEQRVIPITWGGYDFDYLPRKEFKIRRTGRLDRHRPYTVVSDVGSFFQSTFLTALTRWGIGTPEELAQIADGKNHRNEFGTMTDQIREYNALEIALLEELMESFRDLCTDVGYVPKKWQGPGNIASAMFAKHGVPKTSDLSHIPDGVWNMAQAAYYGGRFETTAVGPVAGPVFQADINSAYPWGIAQLPCLMHGKWVHELRGGWSVSRVTFTHSERSLNTLPIRRKDGRIHFPGAGAGWYWNVELDAARRAGAVITAHETWSLVPACKCVPFSFIQGVYDERVRVGKTGRGMVLKLAANSAYGKTAQSVGAPEYANPLYAGMITAMVRAVLTDAIVTTPDATVMLATDGIFSTVKLDLDYGPGLGQWDLAEHPEGMFIIQPGLYFAGDQKPKTRGVPMGKVLERRTEFEQAWAACDYADARHTMRGAGRGGVGPSVPAVTVPLRDFIGLRLAHARGKLDTAGQWVEVARTVSFDWSSKRRPFAIRRDACGLRTLPHLGPDRTVSYGKRIGGNVARDLERLTISDSPDWADRLTPLD